MDNNKVSQNEQNSTGINEPSLALPTHTDATTNANPAAKDANKTAKKETAQQRRKREAAEKVAEKAAAKKTAALEKAQNVVNRLLNGDEDEEKKTRVSDIPNRQRATAALGNKVYINWSAHFGTLQVPNVSQQVLETNARTLSAAIDAADRNESSKRGNTADLQAVNKAIDQAVGKLKTSLKVLYDKNLLESVYLSYGLLQDSKDMYKMPVDNTVREAKLRLLIDKLQEANNPVLAMPNLDLNAWFQLQRAHSRLWLDSENLRQERSTLTQLVRDTHVLVQADVKRVHNYMSFAFSKNELAARRRQMGFLKESV